MKRLSRRDRKILVIGGIFSALILILFYVVLPFYNLQAASREELENKEKLLHRSLQVLNNRKIYEESLAQLDSVFRNYQQNLLDARDTSTAYIQLEELVRSLAAQNGVSVSRSNPLQEKKIRESFARITLQINVESDTTQLTNFLYALSTQPKFLVVDEFYLASFRIQEQIRIQPRLNVSGFIRLS
ncbi:MAG: type II secretion system protein M [Acidobacteria bacterium]|nr:type II secretion system protein M [Acidobacteriota bacterium]